MIVCFPVSLGSLGFLFVVYEWVSVISIEEDLTVKETLIDDELLPS